MASAVRGYRGVRAQMLPVDRLSWGKPRTTGTRRRSSSLAKAVQGKLKWGGNSLKPIYRREVRIVLLVAELAKNW